MRLDAIKNSFRGFDADNLDFNTAGNWPIGVKIIAYLIVFSIVIGAGIHFYISDIQKGLDREVRQEHDLKTQVQIKASQVANLAQLRLQMADVEGRFSELLKQLPTEKEVPGLLEDITDIGRSSGLQIQSIALAAETKSKFYIELPINIKVSGTYHQMGQFVSGVAAISRIVTLHDYSISPSGAELAMTISAKTYRYDDTK
ncbi:MAG: type 4a pilus biogenesis protein PilO [Amphritea sp.]